MLYKRINREKNWLQCFFEKIYRACVIIIIIIIVSFIITVIQIAYNHS